MEAETTKIIARRAREVRKGRGWTAAELGQRMAAQGVPWDRQIVANLENHKRQNVTVNELLALARVLDVAPINLLVPPTNDGPFHVTPVETVAPSAARAWLRGDRPLSGTDLRTFRTEVPLDELGGRS
ncbi:helix-turn-helix domain-containing protein [Streptomyces sp. NPDC056084]|uniref:helix-turn-helix domain-containing protein n=1 Tax=unclassified Streptomyces TaxID=2593676 RepID=UPI0035D99E04